MKHKYFKGCLFLTINNTACWQYKNISSSFIKNYPKWQSWSNCRLWSQLQIISSIDFSFHLSPKRCLHTYCSNRCYIHRNIRIHCSTPQRVKHKDIKGRVYDDICMSDTTSLLHFVYLTQNNCPFCEIFSSIVNFSMETTLNFYKAWGVYTNSRNLFVFFVGLLKRMYNIGITIIIIPKLNEIVMWSWQR